jgi:hypothetical protein
MNLRRRFGDWRGIWRLIGMRRRFGDCMKIWGFIGMREIGHFK